VVDLTLQHTNHTVLVKGPEITVRPVGTRRLATTRVRSSARRLGHSPDGSPHADQRRHGHQYCPAAHEDKAPELQLHRAYGNRAGKLPDVAVGGSKLCCLVVYSRLDLIEWPLAKRDLSLDAWFSMFFT
jgi:hypothetical protein